jgi:mannose-6-phosphate isomerase-like protein (cupin superfamily)
MIDKINLSEKFALFNDRWSPKIIGELNGQYVKLVKIEGELFWHHHDAEDELFFVIKGVLTMKFRDKDVVVKEGECIIVPAGVDHKPVTAEETHILLFEPKSTLHTGNVTNERTVTKLDTI